MRLIDADALVDALMMYTWCDEDGWEIDDAEPKREYIKGWLPDISTIEAEPVRHGKWELAGYGNWLCPECGKTIVHDVEIHFCPKCGMRLEQPDDEYEYYFGHD